MHIDHLHFYVDNAGKWRKWFVEVMGFNAKARILHQDTHTEVVATGNEEVIFVLSSPLTLESPVANYFQHHPSGVANVAFQVKNLTATLEQVMHTGAKLLNPIQSKIFAQGQIKWCRIVNPFGMTHTLIERQGNTPILADDQLEEYQNHTAKKGYFQSIDHLVLNVAKKQLETTVKWYKNAFGFQHKQSFEIQTPHSGLYSQVMVHPESHLQFPVNEPTNEASQIQEFLDFNGGAGIQHIALKTNKITQVIQALRQKGVTFIDVPQTYYQDLKKKEINNHFLVKEWQEIINQQILVDQESVYFSGKSQITPLLLQTFTQPIFDKPTLFFEIIERRNQVKGFGEGNFQALFEAIEREQMMRL